ncbi:MAG: hypothetical protein KDK54_02185 [Leptospiraceae bacterium]|nr:hypothetical protein [Leptospiraceae bacterium]
MKIFISIFSGTFTGVIAMSFLEMAVQSLYPYPEGISKMTPGLLEEYLKEGHRMGLIAILFVMIAGNFLSGFISSLVANEKSPLPPILCSFILMLMSSINLLMIHHPFFYSALSVLLPIPSGLLGFWIQIKFFPRNLDIQNNLK